jgi:hypothetical protein
LIRPGELRLGRLHHRDVVAEVRPRRRFELERVREELARVAAKRLVAAFLAEHGDRCRPSLTGEGERGVEMGRAARGRSTAR